MDFENVFARFSRRPAKGYIARIPEGNSLEYGYVVLDRTRQSQRVRLARCTITLWGKEISFRPVRKDESVNLEGRIEMPRPGTPGALAMVANIKAPKLTFWKTLGWRNKSKTQAESTAVFGEEKARGNGVEEQPLPQPDEKSGASQGK